MNRGLRRDITMRKYISRIKKRLYYIFIKDGYRGYSKNIIIPRWRKTSSWKEADEKCSWVKLLKHGKVYGRSTMSVLEKHYKIKKIREESKKLIKNYMKNELD